jgi:hypothetical protein
MDKIKFLKEEIEMVLNSFSMLEKAKKKELMGQLEDLSEENLLELLKVLYRMRRDFIEAEFEEVKANDEFIKSLNSKND